MLLLAGTGGSGRRADVSGPLQGGQELTRESIYRLNRFPAGGHFFAGRPN